MLDTDWLSGCDHVLRPGLEIPNRFGNSNILIRPVRFYIPKMLVRFRFYVR